MLSYAVTRIYVEWIDILKFILFKSELNVKWSIFGYVWAINLSLKSILK